MDAPAEPEEEADTPEAAFQARLATASEQQLYRSLVTSCLIVWPAVSNCAAI